MTTTCAVCGLKIKHALERADSHGPPLHKTCWNCATCRAPLDARTGTLLEPPEGSNSAASWYCRPHYNKAYKEVNGTLPRPAAAPSTPAKAPVAMDRTTELSAVPSSPSGPPDTRDSAQTDANEPEDPPSAPNPVPSNPASFPESAPESQPVKLQEPEPKGSVSPTEDIRARSRDDSSATLRSPEDDNLELSRTKDSDLTPASDPYSTNRDITDSVPAQLDPPSPRSKQTLPPPPQSALRSDSPENDIAEAAYVPKVGGRGLANQALSYADVKSETPKVEPKKASSPAPKRTLEPAKKDATPKPVEKTGSPKPLEPTKFAPESPRDSLSSTPTTTPTKDGYSPKPSSTSSSTPDSKKPSPPPPKAGDPPVFKTRRERETWEAHQAFLKRQAEIEKTKEKIAYTNKPIKSRAQIRTQSEVEATRKRLEEMGVTWKSWDSPEARMSGLKSAAFGDVVAAASTSLKDDQLELEKEWREIEKGTREAEMAVQTEIYSKPIEVLLEEAASKHRAELELRAIEEEEDEWRAIEEERQLEEIAARVHPFKRFTPGEEMAVQSRSRPEMEPGVDGYDEEVDVLALYGADEDEKRMKKKSRDKDGATKEEKKDKPKSKPKDKPADAVPAPIAAPLQPPKQTVPAPQPTSAPVPQQIAAPAPTPAPEKKKGLMGLFKKLGKK